MPGQRGGKQDRGDGVRADEGRKHAWRDLPDDPLVIASQATHTEVSGHELPLGGLRLGTDTLLYLHKGIPAVCHGPRGGSAHEDEKWSN
jgi:hypothetical protein